MNILKGQFEAQVFTNEYQLVDGLRMHSEHPENFLILPDVIKRYVKHGQFVELRIDSPRFSVHEDAPLKCSCPSCQGELTKPILRHEHPATLMPLPPQSIPSRGWGEDFWVQVLQRADNYFCGVVDNPLVEFRLHGLKQGDSIFFRDDHILAVHAVHRRELVASMNTDDLRELARWLFRPDRKE